MMNMFMIMIVMTYSRLMYSELCHIIGEVQRKQVWYESGSCYSSHITRLCRHTSCFPTTAEIVNIKLVSKMAERSPLYCSHKRDCNGSPWTTIAEWRETCVNVPFGENVTQNDTEPSWGIWSNTQFGYVFWFTLHGVHWVCSYSIKFSNRSAEQRSCVVVLNANVDRVTDCDRKPML